MYEVYLDGKLLYYPGDKVNTVISAILKTKLNDSGTFDVTIPRKNPLYGKFKERVSELLIKKNGKEIWNGEIRGSKGNLKKENVIHAVGELSYLGASSQPQKKYTNVNPLQMMIALVDIHNSQVEPRKQFAVGVVTVGNYNYDWITNYENTLDFIRKEMCDKLGGYLRIRKVDGVRYIDLVSLKDYGKSCEQPIKFGKNLLDYATGISSDAIATVVRPLGVALENGNIEGIDSYLTIESVNNGKDYIENTDAIQSGIGYVWRTVHFNVLTTPEAVKTAGENWLKDNQFQNMTIDVTAIDLSEVNSNIESFELGDSTRIIAKPFGMDRWSYVTEKKLDLLNPVTKHNISIGDNVKKTYTQQVTDEKNSLRKEIPQQSAILQLAKQNASELIKNSTEGNIFLVYDKEGKPKELLIMDTTDVNSATKVWRWNINGLGYSSTGYNGEYDLAMTMDGAIVADRITTGTLNSVRINNGDGKFTVDEKGNIAASAGEVAGWNIAPNMLSKTIDLYPDMTEEGLKDVGDNDPVQYIVWIQKPTSAITASFYIGYRPKSYYLSGGLNWYTTFAARPNGEVMANKFKSSNAEITGGSIKISTNEDESTAPSIIKLSGSSERSVEINPYHIRFIDKSNMKFLDVTEGGLSTYNILEFDSNDEIKSFALGGLFLHNSGMISSQYTWDTVGSDSPNVIVTSSGLFKRSSSSSKRYKTDITENISEELNPQKLYDVPVKMFKYKEGYLSKDDSKNGKDIVGFIVEDLEEKYSSAVQYNASGEAEMWNSNIMIPAMLKLIQEQNERIKQLEERLGITNG